MHELSICQSLLDQVTAIAHERGAACVERITIEWGPLSGIEPVLLADAFAVMRQRGVAATAELLIERVGVRVLCFSCHEESAAREDRLVCGRCGAYRTRIVAGVELRLRQVQMRINEGI